MPVPTIISKQQTADIDCVALDFALLLCQSISQMPPSASAASILKPLCCNSLNADKANHVMSLCPLTGQWAIRNQASVCTEPTAAAMFSHFIRDDRRIANIVMGGPMSSKITVLAIVKAMIAGPQCGNCSPATSAIPTATPA